MGNKKLIIFFIVFAGLFLSGKGINAEGENTGLLPHSKLLYIFDTKEQTLTKTIQRNGQYVLKALFRPKTTMVKCKYTYPLNMEVPQSISGFEILQSENGLCVVSKEAPAGQSLVFPSLDNLSVDTYCYPCFYLFYQSDAPLNVSLHFYADIDNDGVSDFMAYYGKEPSEEIASKIKCYPIENYIEHKVEEFDKSIIMLLYNELRLKRSDRIGFVLRRLDIEIETTVDSQSYVLNETGLYNEEPRDVSVVLKDFTDETAEKAAWKEPDYFNTKADLYGFLEEKGEVETLLRESVFEIAGEKYFLSGVDREKINEMLRKRTEVDLAVLPLKEGEPVSLVPCENKYLELEDVFLAEKTAPAKKEPVLTFKRINPTRYIVEVEAEDSFWITLNENFHTGWKAYVVTSADKSLLGAEKTALQFAMDLKKEKFELLKEHRLVNIFANGWFVPVSEIFGADSPPKFKIIMEFYPQRLYEAGLLISALSFVLMVVGIITVLIVKSKKKTK
ncbi:MAG: hypothetical protein ABH836_01385 [Candidatus Omnitrophota bacterium]